MTARESGAEDQWPPAGSGDEWLLFYLRGLTFAQVARLCRMNAEIVRHSIRQREVLDPPIFGRRLVLHDRPRYRPPRHGRAVAWERRYTAVFRLVAERAASRNNSGAHMNGVFKGGSTTSGSIVPQGSWIRGKRSYWTGWGSGGVNNHVLKRARQRIFSGR